MDDLKKRIFSEKINCSEKNMKNSVYKPEKKVYIFQPESNKYGANYEVVDRQLLLSFKDLNCSFVTY